MTTILLIINKSIVRGPSTTHAVARSLTMFDPTPSTLGTRLPFSAKNNYYNIFSLKKVVGSLARSLARVDLSDPASDEEPDCSAFAGSLWVYACLAGCVV